MQTTRNWRLTRRGRIVRNIVITILFLAALAWFNSATTPAECKVPLDQMSQFCIDVLYP